MTDDTSTGPSELRISTADRDAVFAHARACAPEECCGLFAGADLASGKVAEVHCCTNADASPVTYRIGSDEQFATFRDVERRGLEVVGCFHSHVRSAAEPSRTDIDQAFYPEWIYAIVSLREDEPALRAFRIRDGAVSELPVVIEA